DLLHRSQPWPGPLPSRFAGPAEEQPFAKGKPLHERGGDVNVIRLGGIKSPGTAEEAVALRVQFQDALGGNQRPRRTGRPVGDGRSMALIVLGRRVRTVPPAILARWTSVPRIATAVVSHNVGRRSGAEGKNRLLSRGPAARQ